MSSIYITQPGKLKRKEHTIYFINKEGKKKPIPVETIDEIYLMAPVSVSSQVLHLLSKKKIILHVFDVYGNYDGSFIPKQTKVSGTLVVKQVEHLLDEKKRLYLAKKFVEGSLLNMRRNLHRYGAGDIELNCNDSTIEELMGCEGSKRKEYYEKLDSALKEEFRIGERSRRPPKNYGNALLSFGNSLLYSLIVNEMYRTPLHPGISYLHQPFERRYSLALDIADVFKPLLVDRLVVYIVNKGIIKPSHFRSDVEGILLNEEGKRLFLKYWNERLKKTIKHKSLNRNVSYRRLVRLELNKLIKHLLEMEKYEPFVIWW